MPGMTAQNGLALPSMCRANQKNASGPTRRPRATAPQPSSGCARSLPCRGSGRAEFLGGHQHPPGSAEGQSHSSGDQSPIFALFALAFAFLDKMQRPPLSGNLFRHACVGPTPMQSADPRDGGAVGDGRPGGL